MATSYSPKIITDGLVLCLDAADKKSLLAPPTTNLANNSNGTINWTTADLGATVRTQSTVDANSYHYRFVLDKGSDNNAQLRFAFDHTNLTNGETYIMSYKYKITSGSGSFYIIDFCDQSVTRVTTDIGDGWYYETAYGTRSSYDETYDFFDALATENMTVDIKEIQVEHTSASSPLATPFVSYQRQWKDRTGSNNGTPKNMNDQSNFSSDGGGSLIFDGASDYIEFGNILNIGLSDVSFGGVVKRTGGDGETEWIFSKSYSGSGVGRYWADYNNFNKLRIGFAWAGGHTNYYFNTNVSINTKYHYFAVVDRDGYLSLYLNGELDAQHNISSHSSVNMTNTYPYRLGCYTASDQTTPTYHFNGIVYQHYHYSKALTAEEVLQNYNATKGRFGL